MTEHVKNMKANQSYYRRKLCDLLKIDTREEPKIEAISGLNLTAVDNNSLFVQNWSIYLKLSEGTRSAKFTLSSCVCCRVSEPLILFIVVP